MTKFLPSRETAKAVASALVALAAYLFGIVPADGGLGDVTTVQWLGAIVFLGGAYGITYAVPNRGRIKFGKIQANSITAGTLRVDSVTHYDGQGIARRADGSPVNE